jgi:hypothetical protein
MGFWQHALDVLSGRIAHLNATETKSTSEIRTRIEALNDPERVILKHLFVSANILVEWTITRQREKIKRLPPVDIKTISLNQFRQIHSFVLSYFAFMFYVFSPSREDSLKNSLLHAVNDPPTADRAIALLDRLRLSDAPEGARWRDTFEIAVWQEISRLAGLRVTADLPASRRLAGYAVELYNSAMSRIRSELG